MDADDCVVREVEVFLCNDAVGAQLCVLAHPLRAPWRPYNYNDVSSMRMKTQARRLEVDLPLSTTARNFNRDEGGTEGSHKHIEQLTLRSQQVDQPAVLAMGTLQDGKLLLAPIDLCMQMRPTLQHLNVMRKGGEGGEEGGGEDGEEEEEGGDTGMRAVEVQVQKRETERQQQARLNSFAYLAQKESEEPWKDFKLHMDDTAVAEMVWNRLMAVPKDKAPHQPLSRPDYLRSFAPAFASPQLGTDAGSSADASAQGAADGLLPPPSLSQLSEACKAAFATRMQALFMKHSVCSMENVRTWLLNPKHATVEAQKAVAAAAKDAALLEDKQLHELMMSRSGLPLVCIRRMYVLRQTGKPDTDAFRKVVVDLLQEKEGFRKNEVTEAANAQGVVVTDSMYIRVLKDLCVNRANLWQLKNGADL